MANVPIISERVEVCYFDTRDLNAEYVYFFSGSSEANDKSNYKWDSNAVKVFTSKEFHIPRYQTLEIPYDQALNFFETTTYREFINDKSFTESSLLSTWPEMSLALDLGGKFSPTTAIEVYGKFLEMEPVKANEIVQSYERLLSPIHKVKWRLVEPLIIPANATFKVNLKLKVRSPFYGRVILRGLTRTIIS